MKNKLLVGLAISMLVANNIALAAVNDLVLRDANVRLSTQNLLEGQRVRIYATVENTGSRDLLGFVRFFDNNKQVAGDQPISIVAGRDDTVFIDWTPAPGDHDINVAIIPFDKEADNPTNNDVEKKLVVLSDTDRDGIANEVDPDDDNDAHVDAEDAYPLDKTEWQDSDGDGVGNSKDDDDDNDNVKDAQDQIPLDASETIDTDNDGIGNNADLDDDNDGLPDIDEVRIGTDSLKVDTDLDGVNDKEDAFPLDPTQAYDHDRDGISDKNDQDADNDGIPKGQDVNDTNTGPEIKVTDENKNSTSLVVYPNQIVYFDAGTSTDADGKISSVGWKVEDKEYKGTSLKTSFTTLGKKLVTVTETDDKGESREKVLTIYVIPENTPWYFGGFCILLLALAIWLFLAYSRRRKKEESGKKHKKAHTA